MVQFLVGQGSDANLGGQMRAHFHQTAVQTAIKSGSERLVRFFLENKADTNGINVARFDFLPTPLAVAANVGNLPIAKLLLEYGADPTFKCDPYGKDSQSYCNSSNILQQEYLGVLA